MEACLPIAYLNDFIFCPRSIYFHQLYGRTNQRLYQTTDQTNGKAAHRTIDTKSYTTSRKVLQGLEVYSDRYNLCGKIDTFDLNKGLLTERKKRIKVIYEGYIFQLYGQYHCLTEMGFQVNQISLYSMDDNKSYPVKIPSDDPSQQQAFEDLLARMRSFDLESPFKAMKSKCEHCIYSNLCDTSLC